MDYCKAVDFHPPITEIVPVTVKTKSASLQVFICRWKTTKLKSYIIYSEQLTLY